MNIEVILRALTKTCSLGVAVNQVVIDPTTNTDVRLHDQLDQCSTRYIRVLVGVTVSETYNRSCILHIGNNERCTVTVSVTNDLIVEELVEHNEINREQLSP